MLAHLVSRIAFETALTRALEGSGVPIAFENVAFENEEISAPFVETAILFADTQNPTFGDGFYRCPGIFQLTVRAEDGKGAKEVYELSERLCKYFHRGLTFNLQGMRVLIDKTPSVTSLKKKEPYVLLIISVPFLTDSNN